jgi:hypothetical protein
MGLPEIQTVDEDHHHHLRAGWCNGKALDLYSGVLNSNSGRKTMYRQMPVWYYYWTRICTSRTVSSLLFITNAPIRR